MKGITILALALTGGGLLPGASGQLPRTGRIVGKVALSSHITSRRMRFRPYSDLGVGAVADHRSAGGSEMSNVVIYLESPAGTEGATGRAHPLVIAQRDEAFSPHVLPVVRGSTVEFLNDDPFFHNVFSLSKARTFDLGRYPRGQSKAVRFDRPGAVRVFCHIHADMSAVVLVLDSPLFTTPDSVGYFELDGIPPGEHQVVAWHERANPVVHRVRVVAGESASVDFSIPITNDAPPRR
jgi:plastocyanin